MKKILILAALAAALVGCGGHSVAQAPAPPPPPKAKPKPLSPEERGRLCVYQQVLQGDPVEGAYGICQQAAVSAFGVGDTYYKVMKGAEVMVSCIIQAGLTGCDVRTGPE
jgi:hypothetical protein